MALNDAGAGSYADLPHHVLLFIFGLLDVHDLGRCTRVCKAWTRVAITEELWAALCKKQWYQLPAWAGSWRSTVKSTPTLSNNWRTGKYQRTVLHNHAEGVTSIKFFGDGYISTSLDNTAKVWQFLLAM